MSTIDDHADLARRLRVLEDERAVLDTLHRYGHSIDFGLESDWVDCFVDDAVYESRTDVPDRLASRRSGTGESTPTGVRHRGRAALVAFAAAHTRAPEHRHMHCLVEPRVVVTGDEATATSYFLRVDEKGDGREIKCFGRYLDRLVRCPDGRWRLRERIAELGSLG